MGADLQALAESDQPMAQIFVNSFGQKATLGIWVLVVVTQCVYLPSCAVHHFIPTPGT